MILETLARMVENTTEHAGTLADATRSGNLRVLGSLLGPAARGLLMKRGKSGQTVEMSSSLSARFDLEYLRDRPELSRLYDAAKQSQWDSDVALDWSQPVDPFDDAHELMNDSILPLMDIPAYRQLPRRTQQKHRHAILAWMLSQFLHGEQGALFAATQVTQAVRWLDGKLYGATQVVDEARHVEVFHRYLTQKLGRLYQINDNLYTIIDALMTDNRWDIKFLGMQIMIEGLALGAFGTMRAATKEPLLKELLKRVITDEARHVHYGVLALRERYLEELGDRERKDREDWAFEMAILMRNRFLAHEFYEEYYGHLMSRAAWDKLLAESRFMSFFRKTMFRRIVPNLKRIGLLTDRVRPHYEAIGVLEWEDDRAAPDLTAEDLLVETTLPAA